MIEYRTNKENKSYIEIDIKYGVGSLFSSSSIPEEIKEEAGKIYNSIRDYEYENHTGYISEILIPKTSKLGTFLLENTDMKEIIDNDQVISYEKVVNAFTIAMFEENPISLKILPLFQSQTSGTVEQLGTIYQEDVLNYILENTSFKTYLNNYNGEYEEPKIHTVYENGQFSQRQFPSNLDHSRYTKCKMPQSNIK